VAETLEIVPMGQTIGVFEVIPRTEQLRNMPIILAYLVNIPAAEKGVE
jgi:hypothetical protein